MGVDAIIYAKFHDDIHRKVVQDNLLARLRLQPEDLPYSNHQLHTFIPTSKEGVYSFSTFWRYYGVGYERGPFHLIYCTLAFLLENAISVEYGGDSFEEDLDLVTDDFLKMLMTHWCSQHGLAYYSNWSTA